jgi:hypothetical protein
MAEEKDAYVGLDAETIKRNAEAMKVLAEAVCSPTQAEVDSVVTGHSKPKDKEEKAATKTAVEQKDAAAEEPKASYKTRAMKPTAAEEK